MFSVRWSRIVGAPSGDQVLVTVEPDGRRGGEGAAQGPGAHARQQARRRVAVEVDTHADIGQAPIRAHTARTGILVPRLEGAHARAPLRVLLPEAPLTTRRIHDDSAVEPQHRIHGCGRRSGEHSPVRDPRAPDPAVELRPTTSRHRRGRRTASPSLAAAGLLDRTPPRVVQGGPGRAAARPVVESPVGADCEHVVGSRGRGGRRPVQRLPGNASCC